MDWLNLPIVEMAFTLGGLIEVVGGFWAGYSVENIASYQKGYKRGREKGRMEDDNAKLWELCKRFAEYVSQDRCEGCVCKSRCNDGEIDECWQRTEIREAAHELGIEVD